MGPRTLLCSCTSLSMCALRLMLISLLQHKRITELHASLALPLVTNASLAFLKRHLTLSAAQQMLVDESVAANSARLERFESVLAKGEAEVSINIISYNFSHSLCVCAEFVACHAHALKSLWRFLKVF